MSFFSGSPAQSTQYNTSGSNFNLYGPYQDVLGKTMGKVEDLMDTPYQAYQGDRYADFNQDQLNAFQQVRNQQGSWQPGSQAAWGALNTAGSYNPYQSGMGFINQAAGMQGGADAANPYFQGASQSWTDPGVAQSWMNPYTDQVNDRIADLGVRNLNEKIMPGITSPFLRNPAAYGNAQHADLTGRAIRDTNESILGQQSQNMNQAYAQGMQGFNTEAQRLSGLGQSAGQLANQDRQTQAALGQQAGALASQTQQNFGNLANQYGQWAANQQNMGYRDSSALLSSGQMQQQQQQQDQDWAYQQWQQQQAWPFQMVDWAKSAATGWQLPYSSNQTSFGQGTQQAASPSPFSQILGGATAIAGLATPGASGKSALGNIFGSARGGPVPGYFNGGSIGDRILDVADVPRYAKGGYFSDRSKRPHIGRDGKPGYFIGTLVAALPAITSIMGAMGGGKGGGEGSGGGGGMAAPPPPPDPVPASMPPAPAATKAPNPFQAMDSAAPKSERPLGGFAPIELARGGFFARGGHADAGPDRVMIRSAVHKHERGMHPGEPLTKLAKGGYFAAGGFAPVVSGLRKLAGAKAQRAQGPAGPGGPAMAGPGGPALGPLPGPGAPVAGSPEPTMGMPAGAPPKLPKMTGSPLRTGRKIGAPSGRPPTPGAPPRFARGGFIKAVYG